MTHSLSPWVGANIRAELARRGQTQAELAAVIGVNQSQLSKRIRGLIPLSVDELAMIAEHFEVQPAELIAAGFQGGRLVANHHVAG